MPIQFQEMKFAPPKRKRTGVTIECGQCKRSFYLAPGRAKQGRKFCSMECRKAYGYMTPATHKCSRCSKEYTSKSQSLMKHMTCYDCQKEVFGEATCPRCGKVFIANTSRFRVIHCSEACRRPAVTIDCANCNKTIRVGPSATTRRFCSKSCYRKYTGETIPESKVRNALTAMGIPFEQEFEPPKFKYSIDFFLTEHNVAIEVDGVYWHQDPERDARKTRAIENRLNAPVVRITDLEVNGTNDLCGLIAERIKSVAFVNVKRIQPLLF